MNTIRHWKEILEYWDREFESYPSIYSIILYSPMDKNLNFSLIMIAGLILINSPQINVSTLSLLKLNPDFQHGMKYRIMKISHHLNFL